ncbi:hypothetical protein [Ferruginibacter sp. SUN106]|uniref:hypothetical protein n=1 Tax=Ferruginibacter sp. SUN106 TaxID=2978348 RepID=UPI003D35EE7D
MKIIIFSLGLLVSFNSFAQSNEYIVLQRGDTVSGKVKVSGKQIRVIKAIADTAVFNSEEVRIFVKNNTVKTVLRLVLYGYSENIEDVQSPNYSDPVYDTTVLLTPLITGGKINLFTAKDKDGVAYFFVQGRRDSIPVQLLYAMGGQMQDKESLRQVYQLVNYVSHARIFEDQLRERTDDCYYIREGDLLQLNYIESSFKAFIKRYNKHCN